MRKRGNESEEEIEVDWMQHDKAGRRKERREEERRGRHGQTEAPRKRREGGGRCGADVRGRKNTDEESIGRRQTEVARRKE